MLIANCWQVLKRAWNIRWIVLADLLYGYVEIPRGIFAALSGAATCAAFISRITVQKGVSDADQQDQTHDAR